MTKKPTHIKDYLKAKSPEALKVLMLRNNLKTSCYHDYVINHDGTNWFAWFEADVENLLDKEIQRMSYEELDSRQKL